MIELGYCCNCTCTGRCSWASSGTTSTFGNSCSYQSLQSLKDTFENASDRIDKAVKEFAKETEKTRKKRRNRKVWGKERFENPLWERIPKIIKRTKYQKSGHRWRKR